MKKLTFLIAFFVLLLPALVQAETCYMVTGCEGIVGWFRVNKFTELDYIKSSKALFGTKKLPAVNSVVTTKRRAQRRQISWHDPEDVRCNDIEYLDPRTHQNSFIWDRADDEYEKCQLVINGSARNTMTAGTKIRILGYHESRHLFVLVQIIKSPEWKDEPKHLFFNKPEVFEEEI
jgi:hypothetical protein